MGEEYLHCSTRQNEKEQSTLHHASHVSETHPDRSLQHERAKPVLDVARSEPRRLTWQGPKLGTLMWQGSNPAD